MPIKIYFGVFLLSSILFISSPGKLFLLRDVFFEDEIDEGRMILANEDTIVLELTFKEIGIKRLGFKGKLSKNSIYKKQK
ncbi:MAG: hypothetical protein IPO63_05160 [Bacteroidetes bacterium]|nr:hypothetical protein [Bacteroidota bacterium]